MKPFEPNFKTADSDLDETELIKLHSNGLRGELYEQFRNPAAGDIIHEAEVIAKSHGIYLEYNRAFTGKEKDWMYMVRISIPGGGPLNREQWRIFDELSDKYSANPDGSSSLRLTTRQNIQFHWVKKEHVVEIVSAIAQTGFYSLNGCGDNVRNVMGCPLSAFSTIYDANAEAQRFGRYFRLFWEAGVIGQALYLEAEAAGIRATGIGCYFDDPMHEILGIKDRRYQDLYHFTVGGPLEDTRLTTHPSYPDE